MNKFNEKLGKGDFQKYCDVILDALESVVDEFKGLDNKELGSYYNRDLKEMISYTYGESLDVFIDAVEICMSKKFTRLPSTLYMGKDMTKSMMMNNIGKLTSYGDFKSLNFVLKLMFNCWEKVPFTKEMLDKINAPDNHGLGYELAYNT